MVLGGGAGGLIRTAGQLRSSPIASNAPQLHKAGAVSSGRNWLDSTRSTETRGSANLARLNVGLSRQLQLAHLYTIVLNYLLIYHCESKSFERS